MRFYAIAGVLLALLPLVSAATLSVKESDLEARDSDVFVDTNESISLATNDGNFTPAGPDDERRVCPNGYGYCRSFPDICCPLGGQCCVNRLQAPSHQALVATTVSLLSVASAAVAMVVSAVLKPRNVTLDLRDGAADCPRQTCHPLAQKPYYLCHGCVDPRIIKNHSQSIDLFLWRPDEAKWSNFTVESVIQFSDIIQCWVCAQSHTVCIPKHTYQSGSIWDATEQQINRRPGCVRHTVGCCAFRPHSSPRLTASLSAWSSHEDWALRTKARKGFRSIDRPTDNSLKGRQATSQLRIPHLCQEAITPTPSDCIAGVNVPSSSVPLTQITTTLKHEPAPTMAMATAGISPVGTSVAIMDTAASKTKLAAVITNAATTERQGWRVGLQEWALVNARSTVHCKAAHPITKTSCLPEFPRIQVHADLLKSYPPPLFCSGGFRSRRDRQYGQDRSSSKYGTRVDSDASDIRNSSVSSAPFVQPPRAGRS
ncbi:hypothetical protein AG1IA_07931 [Rhizoctonia solani AG-1 IA]|uniref:Uncharacterized protein n=1 Tax=Thanatephorus cucumeris (strain AG1-IA) TaxID=983506 RepID=L8WJC9_THACA|nr:hypothetical protein AG1IA_07931 [Rhizoctonia solani AG-1 IA]